MEKGRALRLWIGVLAVFAATSAFGLEALGSKEHTGSPGTLRADILVIDTLADLGDIEETPVVFLHDKHTKALGTMGCKTCHLEDKETGKIVLKFKRAEDGSFDELKETYHRECVTCHVDMAAEGVESGPKAGECRGCHNAEPGVESARRPVVVDSALHWRHARHYEKEAQPCAACHHVYDEGAKKIVSAAQPEDVAGACGYCHGDEPTTLDDGTVVRAEQQAAHGECVTCHLTRKDAGEKDNGPVDCAGCHAPMMQQAMRGKNAAMTKDADVRMPRKQPDVVFVKTGVEPGPDGKKPETMKAVPFNHAAHEAGVGECATCHHAGLTSCADCHSVAPTADPKADKGGGISLERAMHQADSTRSCVGCHAERQQDKNCAGCHTFMKKGLPSDPQACATCHKAADADIAMGTSYETDGHRTDTAAQSLATERAQGAAMYAIDDIPETVTIGTLAKDYAASELPHRKIVLSLAKAAGEDGLAKAFHAKSSSLCQGCHHNSPASPTPPKCASCHGKPFDEAHPERPGLKAAYHQQCMGCHTAMKIDEELGSKEFGLDKPVPAATDCTGCHKRK